VTTVVATTGGAVGCFGATATMAVAATVDAATDAATDAAADVAAVATGAVAAK
jgi:hypothetical protein